MKIKCPNGTNCSGSVVFEIPDCFLSEERDTLPPFLSRQLRNEGFLTRLLLEFASRMMTYSIYQCPSCGSQVCFTEYEGRNGRVIKRLGDDCS